MRPLEYFRISKAASAGAVIVVKTFELMGLVTFNIMVALTLSTTVLSNRGETRISSLNPENITAFVEDFAATSAGLRGDNNQHQIVEYMMKHLTTESRYKTRIYYRVGSSDNQQTELEMGRMEFISQILQGLKTMEKHESKTQIDYIKVEPDSRTARVVVTNYERGLVQSQDSFGDMTKIPVLGTTYCDQRVILSDNHVIQLDGAECTTTMNIENGS